MNEVIHELMGYTKLKIVQSKDMFAFSLDSMLLADFTKIYHKTKRIIDLGTGNAPIPLFLSLKTDQQIWGVEIQEPIYQMAKRSVELNKLENQITLLNQDMLSLKTTFEPSSFDLVTCNPPYFKVNDTSLINKSDYQSIARHEITVTLEQIIQTAKYLLKTNGELTMVHRSERLEELIVLLNRHHFAIKRLRFVYPKPGKMANTVLIEAKNQGSPGSMKLLEPLYIYQEDGTYSEETLQIFHYGSEGEH